MTFRRRVALLAGGAVAVAIVVACALAYVAVRDQLLDQVDQSLVERGQEFAKFGAGFGPPGGGRPGFRRPPRRRGELDAFEQIIDASGGLLRDDGLPVDEDTLAIAAGEAGAAFSDTERDDEPVRVLTLPLVGGGAVQIARSTAEVDELLDRLGLLFVFVATGGVALAALLGRVVAGRAVAPLRELSQTAEHVADTSDLSRRIETTGTDEIGRLATSFNEMLDALEQSVGAQRQLVADASHELRTPVTSLRTNIEILEANPELDPARRAALLQTTRRQTEELTVLMNDVIELARGDRPDEVREPVRLDELVEEAVERAALHAGGAQPFDVALDETTVVGVPARLARAINNLLDNAVKWNRPGAPIDVQLRGGVLTVRDRGPGFDAAEIDHVFDRFFRGGRSRDRTGSGLGLAIVRQVVASHGGTVAAANAPGGGAVLTVRLPQA